MRKNNILLIFVSVASLMIFLSCVNLTTPKAKKDIESEFIKRAEAILKLIASSDFEALSKFVYENRGLQFSPYDQEELIKINSTKYANREANITTFSTKQVADFMLMKQTYVWGNYDGIGDQIKLTPKQYYKEFIYDIDFLSKAQAYYINNEKLRKSKLFKYICKIYPASNLVQYDYRGTKETGFNDFKRLYLIFEHIDKQWFIVGIVHGEKTV